MSIFVCFCVMLFLLLLSHLTIDKDFPDATRVGAWIFFGAVALLYIVFAMIF